MSKIKLSKSFSLDEFLFNHHAIVNVATVQNVVNLTALCINVLQPAREALDVPIKISSGFRCKELNSRVGGAKKSQHLSGEAADLVCKDNVWLFDFIKRNLVFDQLIWERGSKDCPAWVHVSYVNDRRNRMQILFTIDKSGVYYKSLSDAYPEF